MDFLSRILRAEKPIIARGIAQKLAQRLEIGPPEPALDMYIYEANDVADRLDAHVTGKTLARAAQATRLAHLDACDDDVDSLCRHIEDFIYVEGHRRTGPHVQDALALHKAAFPEGRAHLDAPVREQNVHCRAALEVLCAPEHAATIVAIKLPIDWIDALEAGLNASEDALNRVVDARTDRKVHVGLGRDVEADWVDIMRRLRLQVTSRGRRGGPVKEAEGMHLLEPLLVAIQKLHTEHASRVTRKAKKDAAAAQDAAQGEQPAAQEPLPAEEAALPAEEAAQAESADSDAAADEAEAAG